MAQAALFEEPKTTEQTATAPPAAPTAAPPPDIKTTTAPQPTAAPKPPTQVSTTPVLREVKPEETIQGQLETLFSEDNPLLEYARQRGMRVAESRGLAGSTYGLQIGEEALMSQAVPIAAGDADTYRRTAELNQGYQNQFNAAEQLYQHQKKLSEQAFQQSWKLSEQGFQHAVKLSEQDYFNQTRLLGQEIAGTLKLSAQEHAQMVKRMGIDHTQIIQRMGVQSNLDKQMANLQAQLQRGTLSHQARLDIQNRLKELSVIGKQNKEMANLQSQLERGTLSHSARLQIENRLKEIQAQTGAEDFLQSKAASRNLQMQYLQESGAITRQAMSEISAINRTEGLSAAQQRAAVQTVRQQTENDLRMLQGFYGSSPSWNSSWGTGAKRENPVTGSNVTWEQYNKIQAELRARKKTPTTQIPNIRIPTGEIPSNPVYLH